MTHAERRLALEAVRADLRQLVDDWQAEPLLVKTVGALLTASHQLEKADAYLGVVCGLERHEQKGRGT